MSVTLDVLRLSGWLNADAYCHVEYRRARKKENEGTVRTVGAGDYRTDSSLRLGAQLEMGHCACAAHTSNM